MHKARLIYAAVNVCLVVSALVTLLNVLPSGMHDGAD